MNARGRTCRSFVLLGTAPAPRVRFECSLTRNHPGRHAAKGVTGATLRTWTR